MPFNQRLKMYKQVQKFQGFFAKNRDVKNKEFPGVGALEALSTQYSLEKELDYKPRQLAGKCSNGAERDHGLVTHAVNHIGALGGTYPPGVNDVTKTILRNYGQWRTAAGQ